MREVRIIIAGSRDFSDYDLLDKYVNGVISSLGCRNIIAGIGSSGAEEKDCIHIISGTARGADRLGEQFAKKYGYEVKRFFADWDGLGKRAGYVRNAEMARYAMADGNYGVLVAFWDGESRGTKHMIDVAKKNGLEVHVAGFGYEKNRG